MSSDQPSKTFQKPTEESVKQSISKLQAAIEYEMKHLYINAKGKSGTFAKYIQKESQVALKVFKHSNKWSTINALIKRYEFVDITSRMSTAKKILEILDELEAIYQIDHTKSQAPPTSPNSNTVKAKFIQTVDSPQAQSSSEKVEEISNVDISDLDIQFVKGVGPKLAEKLNRLEIQTCEDLLHYLPRNHISYQDRVPIGDLEPEQDVTIFGEIFKITAFQSRKKGLVILTIVIKDATGKVKITKFLKGNSTHFYIKQFQSQYPNGSQVLCSGTVKIDKYSKGYTINNPILETVSSDFTEGVDNVHTGRIVPIYPLTEGLSLTQLRKLIFNSVNTYKSNLKEFIPEGILEEHKLMSYQESLEKIHFPCSLEAKDNAARRLIFNEFFLMQLRFLQRKNQIKKQSKGVQFDSSKTSLVDKLLKCLGFELTYAQKRVFFDEILPDMASEHTMHRMVQGDVGSGKTIVAFLALLVAVENGYQGAVMAPTEILAEQHFKKFKEWVEKMESFFSLKIGFLSGKQKAKPKRETLQALANGQINIVVGTHALIQEQVEFNNLGLIIIDEQHRFGVKQRDLLVKKGLKNSTPEKLFMSATPIPRTLSLAIHGDLDMSEIDEMPPGRAPIDTQIVQKKKDAYKQIINELQKGNQAYIVFPLIDESETLSAKAATVEYERLKEEVFQDFNLGLLHGKLKEDAKEEVMKKFRNKDIDILVATTVIEVGVDIPDATVMLIESAERFGLAQLHQLRGRVGRSSKQSYCLLSSNSNSPQSQIRLKILTSTSNGFIVAQQDMKLRGAGDFLGTRQSGIPSSTLASLNDNEEILYLARNAAKHLIQEKPELEGLDPLKAKLEKSVYSELLSGG